MGKVVEKFKAGMFSIELDAGRTVLAARFYRIDPERRQSLRSRQFMKLLFSRWPSSGDADSLI
jgi:hypothetical protein